MGYITQQQGKDMGLRIVVTAVRDRTPLYGSSNFSKTSYEKSWRAFSETRIGVVQEDAPDTVVGWVSYWNDEEAGAWIDFLGEERAAAAAEADHG